MKISILFMADTHEAVGQRWLAIGTESTPKCKGASCFILPHYLQRTHGQFSLQMCIKWNAWLSVIIPAKTDDILSK